MHTHINVRRFYCHCCAIETLNSNSPSIFCQAIMSLVIIGQMYLLFTTNSRWNVCYFIRLVVSKNLHQCILINNTHWKDIAYLSLEENVKERFVIVRLIFLYSFPSYLTFYEITSCFLKKHLEFERCSLNFILFEIRHMIR